MLASIYWLKLEMLLLSRWTCQGPFQGWHWKPFPDSTAICNNHCAAKNLTLWFTSREFLSWLAGLPRKVLVLENTLNCLSSHRWNTGEVSHPTPSHILPTSFICQWNVRVSKSDNSWIDSLEVCIISISRFHDMGQTCRENCFRGKLCGGLSNETYWSTGQDGIVWQQT